MIINLRTAAMEALAYMESVGQMDMHPEEWAVVEHLRAALNLSAPPQPEPAALEPRTMIEDFIAGIAYESVKASNEGRTVALTVLPEHWVPIGLLGANASFQRAAREYAEEYARAILAAGEVKP